jgi:hypothetical protein
VEIDSLCVAALVATRDHTELSQQEAAVPKFLEQNHSHINPACALLITVDGAVTDSFK